MRIPDRIRRWHSPSLFTLVALCFLLPFATVTFVGGCGTQYGKTSFTGVQLVTHTVPRGTGTCGGSAAANICVEGDSATTAEIALGAAVVGLILGLLGVAVGPGWCALIGLAALLQIGTAITSPHGGYWLAFLLFAWAGILHWVRWRQRLALFTEVLASRGPGLDARVDDGLVWGRIPTGRKRFRGYRLVVTAGAIALLYGVVASCRNYPSVRPAIAPLVVASWAVGIALIHALYRARARRTSSEGGGEVQRGSIGSPATSAVRALSRVALATLVAAAVAFVVVGPAILTGRGAASTPHQPKSGSGVKRAGQRQVYVCRNPFYAAQALGGEQCYGNEADVGTAPVANPKALMCEASLTGVKGEVIGIRVLYKGQRIVNWHTRAPSRTAEPYVSFDRNGVTSGSPGDDGTGLRPGRYRCEFLVNGDVARARTISVS